MTADRAPKLLHSLRGYRRADLGHDLLAGLTVGLVALPLAMAFAISSGVKPEAGIYTAIVAGLVVGALGGSRFQVSGPTGAFVVVVAGIVSRFGVSGLLLCTLMAGAILVFLGVSSIGSAVKFIPRPVVIGFTNGIAVLIASTQIKDLLGLPGDNPGDFIERIGALAANFDRINFAALLLAVGSLLALIVWQRTIKRVPGAIVVLVAATAITALVGLQVETIGSRFGGIPSGLPQLSLPAIQFHDLPHLFRPALTVALLGAIESLMSAVVADRIGGDKHNPNVELVAQGVGNLVSPLFGGMPITGAIARTATNIKAGARTPLASIFHAATLLLVLLVAAPLAAFIPLPVLAAILLMVAWNMGEWHEIPQLLRLTRTEVAVWAATFLLTVFADLTIAVETGMVLAALLFIVNVTDTTTVSEVTDDYVESGRIHILQDKRLPPYAKIFRIHGPFLFGVTDKLSEISERIETLPSIVILRLRNMTALDATGLHALEDLALRLHASNRTLLLCGARPQPLRMMRRADFQRIVGARNICHSVAEALDRAAELAGAQQGS